MKAPYFHFVGYDENCNGKKNFIKKLEELGYQRTQWGCSNLKDCVGVAIYVNKDEKHYTLCSQDMDSDNPHTSWTCCRERFSAEDTFFKYLKDFEALWCSLD
jgi:hypothetical protein